MLGFRGRLTKADANTDALASLQVFNTHRGFSKPSMSENDGMILATDHMITPTYGPRLSTAAQMGL